MTGKGNHNTPACSLVIRCFNEEAHIGRLLTGIMAQTLKDVEIIVVDSGSTDATLSIASQYPVKILTITPEQFSFGRSLNIGCAATTSDFIAIASAHVYPVYTDWLEHLLKPFADSGVAIVYGKQRADGAAKYAEHMIYKKWYPDESTTDQRHPFCNNANAAIRRSLLEAHPFNEALTGLEDLDWAKRAIERGEKVAYSAEAEIVHVHNETLTRVYHRYMREAIAFKHIYPHERFRFLDVVRLVAGNILSDCYYAAHDRMLVKNVSQIVSFRFMQFWGAYRGFSRRALISQQVRNRLYYPNGFAKAGADGSVREAERAIEYECRHH